MKSCKIINKEEIKYTFSLIKETKFENNEIVKFLLSEIESFINFKPFHNFEEETLEKVRPKSSIVSKANNILLTNMHKIILDKKLKYKK